jgi:hypothetical protein
MRWVTLFRRAKRFSVTQNGSHLYAPSKKKKERERESGVIRAALRYNNLLLVYNKNLSPWTSIGLRFSTSPRIDFIFHIPPTEKRTIVRMIPPACENGITLLFRRRSYPPLQILPFTGSALSLAHSVMFLNHRTYSSQSVNFMKCSLFWHPILSFVYA